MIEKLIIHDFQVHDQFVLKLSSGVTTLTGSSDVGKSSILRGLCWLAFNRPAGNAIIRRGGGPGKVRLDVDGHTIQRIKGDNRNEYCLDDQVYKSFGQDVPAPVGDLLNLGEVNVQRQHDPPWWFCLSPGEVSRELNAIVDLGLIDSALAHLNAGLRKAKAEAEVAEKRLKEAEERRDALAWAEEASRDLVEAEAEAAVVQRFARDVEWLSRLLEEGEDLTRTLVEGERDCDAMEAGIAKVNRAYAAAVELRGKAGWLAELIEQVQAAEDELCQATSGERRLSGELARIAASVCPTCRRPLT